MSLFELCQAGDARGVRAALARGADAGQSGPRHRTCLAVAAARGHELVVGLLLDRGGVNVNGYMSGVYCFKSDVCYE
jgi:hypothetical protein